MSNPNANTYSTTGNLFEPGMRFLDRIDPRGYRVAVSVSVVDPDIIKVTFDDGDYDFYREASRQIMIEGRG